MMSLTETSKMDHSANNIKETKKVFISLKHKGLTEFPTSNIFQLVGIKEENRYDPSDVCDMNLSGNAISVIPPDIGKFGNVQELDFGNNRLTFLPSEIANLTCLKTLNCKNNRLNCDSLPKDLDKAFPRLESFNLSGNLFINFPEQVLQITSMTTLHIGGNRIRELPENIDQLQDLERLYLGGNHISVVPPELGNLTKLTCLVLCDNRISELPFELANLKKLRSLSLHNNQLTTLPPDIIKLSYLCELSLRGNPLVVRFVRDLMWDPPNLMELAARTIKNKHVLYNEEVLPRTLIRYLETACHCLNPECNGVYFDAHVESVKFVDFCGKFRLPLMQYLCSPQCYSYSSSSSFSSSSDTESEDDTSVSPNVIKKVLLG